MITEYLTRLWTRLKQQQPFLVLKKNLEAFSRDSNGTVAILVAGALLALLLCAGGAIDFSRYYMLKKAAHNAADAAILAVAARTDLDTLSKKQNFAQNIFDLQFAERYGDVTNTTIQISEGQNTPTTQISGNLLYNTYLLELFGIPTLPINFTSETTHQNLEVVLVLDNSGSLSAAELQTMEEAAELLVDIAFDSAPAGQSVEIGVVPFSGTVNIGSLTQQQQRDWIDGGDGSTPGSQYHGQWFIHAERQNGTVVVDPDRKVNHLDLFNSVGVGATRNGWQGCVEARPNDPFTVLNINWLNNPTGLDVTDDPPSAADPNTKWVPQFWPDAAECRANNHTSSSDKGACMPANSDSLGAHVNEHSVQNTDNYDFVWDRTFLVEDATAKALYNEYLYAVNLSLQNNSTAWQNRFGNSLSEDEIRLGYVGVWDAATSRYVGKYNYATGRASWLGRSNGNRGCGAALSPLSNASEDAKDTLDSMTAQRNGGTSITTGVMWGLRVLSPGEPFTEGAPFDDASTRKVMVLMSDGGNWYAGGANRHIHVQSQLTAYGFLASRRFPFVSDMVPTWASSFITNTQLVPRMDRRTQAACDLVQSNGVEIYTITLDDQLNDPDGIMLGCATSPQHTHVATLDDAETLDQAFRDIARDMIAPYLSQ